jgi:acylglycerol lipase
MALNFYNNQKNIVLFDVRGHGNSGGIRGDTPSVAHVMNDIESVIKYCKKKYKNYKMILRGHSSGAETCINYSDSKCIQPDEYLFIAPYLGNDNKNIF